MLAETIVWESYLHYNYEPATWKSHMKTLLVATLCLLSFDFSVDLTIFGSPSYGYFEYQMNNGFFLSIESIVSKSLAWKIFILVLEQHLSYN